MSIVQVNPTSERVQLKNTEVQCYSACSVVCALQSVCVLMCCSLLWLHPVEYEEALKVHRIQAPPTRCLSVPVSIKEAQEAAGDLTNKLTDWSPLSSTRAQADRATGCTWTCTRLEGSRPGSPPPRWAEQNPREASGPRSSTAPRWLRWSAARCRRQCRSRAWWVRFCCIETLQCTVV